MEGYFPSLPELVALAHSERINSSTITSVRDVLQALKNGLEVFQAAAMLGMLQSTFLLKELRNLV